MTTHLFSSDTDSLTEQFRVDTTIQALLKLHISRNIHTSCTEGIFSKTHTHPQELPIPSVGRREYGYFLELHVTKNTHAFQNCANIFGRGVQEVILTQDKLAEVIFRCLWSGLTRVANGTLVNTTDLKYLHFSLNLSFFSHMRILVTSFPLKWMIPQYVNVYIKWGQELLYYWDHDKPSETRESSVLSWLRTPHRALIII